MAHKVIMPKQGLQMTEGYITRWLKNVGDPVAVGDELFEMETDKLTITIDAQQEGVLLKIIHEAGDTVPITQTIAWIGEAGEVLPNEDENEKEAQTPALEAQGAVGPGLKEQNQMPLGIKLETERVFISPRAKTRAEENQLNYQGIPGSGPDNMVIERDILNALTGIKATPLAKKVAGLHQVDLQEVAGTGIRGKITTKDVYQKAGLSKESALIEEDMVLPVTGMRKLIAQNMMESIHTMAQANHRIQVNMEKAIQLRKAFEKTGNKISFNDILLYIVNQALKQMPWMNVSWQDEAIVQKAQRNIGLAVATDKGLLVPKVPLNALEKLEDIAAYTKAMIERVKTNRLDPDELTGGTFTISNLGMTGLDSFTAIINPPEAAILAVGTIKKQPIVTDEGEMKACSMMWLSLSYDHRMIDGMPAALFLAKIKTLLEEPYLLL